MENGKSKLTNYCHTNSSFIFLIANTILTETCYSLPNGVKSAFHLACAKYVVQFYN